MKIRSIIFFLSLLVFLTGVSVKLKTPLVEYDWMYLSPAENWSRNINYSWSADHPPLYSFILSAFFWIFGIFPSVARLMNAFWVIVTAFLIYYLAVLFFNRGCGFWAAALYLLNPVVIQGTTLIDCGDTTLLPLVFTLLVICLVHFYKKSSFLGFLSMIAVIALCFWVKINSTLAFFFGVLSFPLTGNKVVDRSWLKIVLAWFIGAVIFILSWAAVSISLWGRKSFLSILFSVGKGFVSRVELNPNQFLSGLGFNTIRIIFWFSPFLLLLWLYRSISIWRSGKNRESDPMILVTWICFFYTLGYWLIGGTNYGFPRYHAAILPLFVIIVVPIIEETVSKLSAVEKNGFLVLVASLVFFSYWSFQDPLLFVNLRWKELLLNGESIIPAAAGLLLQVLILVLAICFAVFFFFRITIKEKFILSLLTGILVSNLFLDLLQKKAEYITSYEYGSRGKRQVIEMVLPKIEENDPVLTTAELIYDLRTKKVPEISWKIWDSAKTILKNIEESKPKVIIIGLNTHSFSQLRDIFGDKGLQTTLKKEYENQTIGTYFVWIRKKK